MMMIITPISRDVLTLPQAMLGRFKNHARIDHCDDDELIADMLARAIEYFEVKTESSVFQAQFSWAPVQADFNCSNAALSPVQPVGSLTVTVPGDPDPIDVTADYVLQVRGVYGNQITYIAGAFAQGMQCAIATGYTAETLPPGIASVVLQFAAHLYKYREIYQDSNLDLMPYWFDQLIAGYWIPRA